VFAGEGKGRFRDISASNGDFSGQPWVSRGLLVGDLNNDGALDLVVTQVAGRARVYRNKAPDRGRWLMVRLRCAGGKRDACGARATVEAGGRRWVATLAPSQGYL